MDTVISVEEDPEIEALSRQTLTTPTSLVLREKPQQCDHTHIDLELGHDIPGLVSPSDPEVGVNGRLSSVEIKLIPRLHTSPARMEVLVW